MKMLDKSYIVTYDRELVGRVNCEEAAKAACRLLNGFGVKDRSRSWYYFHRWIIQG